MLESTPSMNLTKFLGGNFTLGMLPVFRGSDHSSVFLLTEESDVGEEENDVGEEEENDVDEEDDRQSDVLPCRLCESQPSLSHSSRLFIQQQTDSLQSLQPALHRFQHRLHQRVPLLR